MDTQLLRSSLMKSFKGRESARMDGWSHQPSVLFLFMGQHSKAEPDCGVVRGFPVHREKPCLFKITVYLRYSLERPLFSEGLKSRLNRPGPWAPSPLPGCAVKLFVNERVSICLKTKGCSVLSGVRTSKEQ